MLISTPHLYKVRQKLQRCENQSNLLTTGHLNNFSHQLSPPTFRWFQIVQTRHGRLGVDVSRRGRNRIVRRSDTARRGNLAYIDVTAAAAAAAATCRTDGMWHQLRRACRAGQERRSSRGCNRWADHSGRESERQNRRLKLAPPIGNAIRKTGEKWGMQKQKYTHAHTRTGRRKA